MLGIACPSNSSMNEFKCGHFAKTFLFFVALKIRPLKFSKFANGDKMKLSFEIENLSTKEKSGKIQNFKLHTFSPSKPQFVSDGCLAKFSEEKVLEQVE